LFAFVYLDVKTLPKLTDDMIREEAQLHEASVEDEAKIRRLVILYALIKC
jgi:hypothetical protein